MAFYIETIYMQGTSKAAEPKSYLSATNEYFNEK